MDSRLVCAGVLFLVLTATITLAEVVPALHLESLVREADIIVLGTLDELHDLGKTSLSENGLLARLVTGTISVRQVLKGPSNLEGIAFRSPARPATVEGLQRALDDPDLDTRLWARHGLDSKALRQ